MRIRGTTCCSVTLFSLTIDYLLILTKSCSIKNNHYHVTSQKDVFMFYIT